MKKECIDLKEVQLKFGLTEEESQQFATRQHMISEHDAEEVRQARKSLYPITEWCKPKDAMRDTQYGPSTTQSWMGHECARINKDKSRDARIVEHNGMIALFSSLNVAGRH